MPRLSERQQIALLLHTTTPSASYPPLSQCLALHSAPLSIYESWTSGRRRLWDRRHTHPSPYLYNYLLPTELPRNGKFTVREHLRFLAALRLVPSNNPHERWARLALLMPGRVGSECRRYYNRIGRAGFINTDGFVRKNLVCRARVLHRKMPLVSANPLFLRRNLRKFVPEHLPHLNDALLRLPSANANHSIQVESLTYRPAKPPPEDDTSSHPDVENVSAGANGAPLQKKSVAAGAPKRRTKTKSVSKLNDDKTANKEDDLSQRKNKLLQSLRNHALSLASPVEPSKSVPSSAKKPPLPSHPRTKQKQQARRRIASTKAGNKSLKKQKSSAQFKTGTPGKDVATPQTSDATDPQPNAHQLTTKSQPPLKDSMALSRELTSNDKDDVPVLVKLRLKEGEQLGTVYFRDSPIKVTCRAGYSNAEISRQPTYKDCMSNVDDISVDTDPVSKDSACPVGNVHERNRNLGQQSAEEPGTVVKDSGNLCPNLKPTSETGASKLSKCPHDPPIEIHKPFESQAERDSREKISTSVLMPSSRRLYGPVHAKRAPSEASGWESVDQGSLDSQSVEEAIRKPEQTPPTTKAQCHEMNTTVTNAECELEKTFEHASHISTDADDEAAFRAPGYAFDPSKDNNVGMFTFVEPLQPFDEDEAISLVDPTEGSRNQKLDAVLGDDPKTEVEVMNKTHVVSPSSDSGKTIAASEGPSRSSSASTKRTSIDFLLCGEDTDCPMERPLKKPYVPATEGHDELLPEQEEWYRCDRCATRKDENIESKWFQIVDVETEGYEKVFLWFLPRAAVMWTRAWGSRHWRCHMSEQTLAEAEHRFDSIYGRARQMVEALGIFKRLTPQTGVRLGHDGERGKLLDDFQDAFDDLLEKEAVAIRAVNVSVTEKCAGEASEGRPMVEDKFDVGDFGGESIDLGYDEVVDCVCKNWNARISGFLERLNEMERRQEMECQAVESIRSVMVV